MSRTQSATEGIRLRLRLVGRTGAMDRCEFARFACEVRLYIEFVTQVSGPSGIRTTEVFRAASAGDAIAAGEAISVPAGAIIDVNLTSAAQYLTGDGRHR